MVCVADIRNAVRAERAYRSVTAPTFAREAAGLQGGMISGLNHANISTDKLAETCAFFVDVLGLRVGPRPGFSFPGAWLYAGDQPVVHLVERSPQGAVGPIDHIAFTVEDFEGALANLSRLGVPYNASDIPEGFGRQAFLFDPNGVRIELNAPAARIKDPS